MTTRSDPFHHDQLDALAQRLEEANGMEVDFEPTPHGRRLLETIGVRIKGYEQFELPWAPPRLVHQQPISRIERVPSDLRLANKLGEYRQLGKSGWDVTALLAPDSKTVVLLACREGAA